MVSYVTVKYAPYLYGARETVSAHFRLGSDEEPGGKFDKVVNKRKSPTPAWYSRVMLREFNASNVVFLIFTDNPRRLANTILSGMRGVKMATRFVDEDFATSMLLMSMCKHHIGSVSTFSFWGAYLDKEQPHGGKTIFPPEYLTQHGHSTMPFKEWLIVP